MQDYREHGTLVNSSLRVHVTTPTQVVSGVTGPQHVSWYKSEFGCVAWSSFESISAQLPPDQWSLRSPSVYYRNWPVDVVIQSFFGAGAGQRASATGKAAFQTQLYQSMIGQQLFLKREIESWRATNVFGTTIWMFNDLWPSGSWGSIEYGGPTAGQVCCICCCTSPLPPHNHTHTRAHTQAH